MDRLSELEAERDAAAQKLDSERRAAQRAAREWELCKMQLEVGGGKLGN